MPSLHIMWLNRGFVYRWVDCSDGLDDLLGVSFLWRLLDPSWMGGAVKNVLLTKASTKTNAKTAKACRAHISPGSHSRLGVIVYIGQEGMAHIAMCW